MHKREKITQEMKTHTETETNYILIPTKISVDDTIETSYGIGAVQNDVLIECVLDVSLDREKVKTVVDLCNKEKLELCHLTAVAEDTAI